MSVKHFEVKAYYKIFILLDSYSKSVSVKTKRGFVVVNFDCKQKQTNRQNLYEYVNSTFKRHDFQSHCNES